MAVNTRKTIALVALLLALPAGARAGGPSSLPRPRLENRLGLALVEINSGRFVMGSPADEAGRDPDERQHEVRITRAFLIGAAEVTQGVWKKVMGDNPSRFTECGDDCPVEQVSWYDAVRFCNRLSKMSGLRSCYRGAMLKEGCEGYRLPTEAEWEYAARAGGVEPTEAGHCVEGDSIRPAGDGKPNAWGLHGMLGNVAEWVSDWYRPYPAGFVEDPYSRPVLGGYPVVRGGSWKSPKAACRPADRSISMPGIGAPDIGFRIARTIPGEDEPYDEEETQESAYVSVFRFMGGFGATGPARSISEGASRVGPVQTTLALKGGERDDEP